MIKECLNVIADHKLDFGEHRKKSLKMFIESYDEQQIIYLLQSQNRVMDDITILFYPNIGFRCTNETLYQGKNPICKIIQRILNEKYLELINI